MQEITLEDAYKLASDTADSLITLLKEENEKFLEEHPDTTIKPDYDNAHKKLMGTLLDQIAQNNTIIENE